MSRPRVTGKRDPPASDWMVKYKSAPLLMRGACTDKVLVAEQIEAKRFVFVDEMGSNTSLHPLFAWSMSGERALHSVPRNRGKYTTLVASMTVEGMGPALAMEGSTDSEVFETYVERFLVPSLQAGQVVAMDNLNAHKGERIRELIEAADCKLLYLPTYSPDLSPIEPAFAKIKGMLRRAEARDREVLVELLGVALSTVKADDARGFFWHCGYRRADYLFLMAPHANWLNTTRKRCMYLPTKAL